MIIVPKIKLEMGFNEARIFVRKELEKLAAAPALAQHYPLVIRMEVPVMSLDVLQWLSQQYILPRSYWGEQDGSAFFAGAGSAWEDFDRNWGEDGDLWEGLKALLDSEDELRVFVGMCFHRSLSGPEWKSFKSIRFFVPRFEVLRDDRGTRFICNVVLGEGEKLPLKHVLQELDSLRLGETVTPPQFQVLSRENAPNYEQWSLDVASVLHGITTGEIDKAVLCRRVTLGLDQSADPCILLQMLTEMHSGGYSFLYQFSEVHAFLGVSPELLYARVGDTVRSEAIAGTRIRGIDQHQDDELARELLKSTKDGREQRLVLGALVAAFRQVCLSYAVEEKVSVLKFGRQQHLVTPITGRLAEGVSDRDLCVALHPTPAVGGFPTDKALQVLHRIEGFDRGWFASPVGYIQKSCAKLAVAIRSCLVADSEIHLYSGAGIVEGSEALAEWDETEIKIRQYLDIFYGH